MNAWLSHRAAKPLVFLLALLPLVRLVHGAWTDGLGPNPAEALTRGTGDWVLRFLCLTLAVTPLRQWAGWTALARFRRMLGLFAFFYASLHFTTYFWLDQFFDLQSIAHDIMKRPFITVGFAALVLMTPLALTSNAFSIRKLGGRRWQALHRSVYGIAILGVVHFWWLVKADVREPMLYAFALAWLLILRAWWREVERRRQLAVSPPVPAFKGKVIRIVPADK